jgi:two-component system response regulator PilR (NtrC family)
MVTKVARSQAPVHISGESGTGKELVARMIHETGPRREGPFVPINCGAIPTELMESEFFGHKKGSFTGAHADKEGLFQAAQGGTLFLDEVAELPVHMQVKLLRVIQEKAVRPIGARAEVPVDVRILSATHKNLAKLVDLGAFRQDLFYRINVIELRVPPLRERRDDIPKLAGRVLERLGRDGGNSPARLTPDALRSLLAYDFPGNVRELENILERAVALCENGTISAEDMRLVARASATSTAENAERWANTSSQQGAISPLPATGAPAAPSGYDTPPPSRMLPDSAYVGDLAATVAETERAVIMKALEATRWNRTAAARQLGLTLRQLRYRLEKLGIE